MASRCAILIQMCMLLPLLASATGLSNLAPIPSPTSDFVDNGQGGAYNIVSIPTKWDFDLEPGGDEITDTPPKEVQYENMRKWLQSSKRSSDVTGFETPSGLFKCANCDAPKNGTKQKCNCGTPTPKPAIPWREDDVYVGPTSARTPFISRLYEYRWAKEMIPPKPRWPLELIDNFERHKTNLQSSIRAATSDLRTMVSTSAKSNIFSAMDVAQMALERVPFDFKEFDTAKAALEDYMRGYDEAYALWQDYYARNPTPEPTPAVSQ